MTKPMISITYKNGDTQFGADILVLPDDLTSEAFAKEMVAPVLHHLQSMIDKANGLDPLLASAQRAGLDMVELRRCLENSRS